MILQNNTTSILKKNIPNRRRTNQKTQTKQNTMDRKKRFKNKIKICQQNFEQCHITNLKVKQVF